MDGRSHTILRGSSSTPTACNRRKRRKVSSTSGRFVSAKDVRASLGINNKPLYRPFNAYVTMMLRDDMLPAVVVLGSSVRRYGTKYDLVVMVTSNVGPRSRDILRKLYDRVIEVDTITACCQKANLRSLTIHGREDYLYSLTKGNLFKLTDYEKILYVDSNIFFQRNVDDIFDLDPPCGILSLLSSSDQDRWHGAKIPPEYIIKALQLARGVKASLMLLRPNFETYTHCLSRVTNFNNVHFVRPDEEFFTSMFHRCWSHIHCKYACVPWQIARVRLQPAGICLEHLIPWEDGCNLTNEVLEWRKTALVMVNYFPSVVSAFKKFYWFKEGNNFKRPSRRRIHPKSS